MIAEKGTAGAALERGSPFREKLVIGDLEVTPPLVMAPMAGVTNAAFRKLLARLGGVGLYYTEMLSARALRHEAPGKSLLMATTGESRPLCMQIFASDPEDIPPAVERGQAWSPEVWDLNFGCPAPGIVKGGAGAALMRDLGKARSMAAAMREAVVGPLLFKVRADEDRRRFRDFLEVLAECGVDAVVVHARKDGQKLGRPACWNYIREAVDILPVPVIGNGDIRTVEDVARMISTTGCSGVMAGRGAVTKPWLFRQSAELFGVSLPAGKEILKSEIFEGLAGLLQGEFQHPRDLYRLREFTSYFAANYKFGHQLWKAVQNAPDLKAAVLRARSFFERNRSEDRLHE